MVYVGCMSENDYNLSIKVKYKNTKQKPYIHWPDHRTKINNKKKIYNKNYHELAYDLKMKRKPFVGLLNCGKLCSFMIKVPLATIQYLFM